MSEILTKGLFGVLFLDNAEASTKGMLALYVALACILPAVIGYLLGSVNTAVLISRAVYHEDIRTKGSGNAGMTNMMRNYGRGAAAATLIGDMLKTAISVGIGALLVAESGMYIAGLFSVIGHMFPVFFGFKGGKGVASTAALVLCTEPVAFFILIFIFICIVAATKFLSLGSIMTVMMYPLILNRVYILIRDPAGVPFIPTMVSFVLMVMIVAMHRENIQRLMKGTESKFTIKKSVKAPPADAVTEDESDSAEKNSK